MKKNLLIAGPAGSGKSALAQSILDLHNDHTLTSTHNCAAWISCKKPFAQAPNAIIVLDEIQTLYELHSVLEFSKYSARASFIFLTQLHFTEAEAKAIKALDFNVVTLK